MSEFVDFVDFIDLAGLSAEDLKSRVKAERLYKLSSNESPLGPSPRVVETVREMAAGLHTYPPRDDALLRLALAAHHGRGLRAENFVAGHGGSEMIEFVAREFVGAGDEIIVSSPTYPVYSMTARMRGAAVVDVALNGVDFSLEVDALLAAVTARTRVIYVCNPNNPTGAMVDEDAFARLVDALSDDIVVVADQVYGHFVESDDFPDTIGHILAGRQVVMIQSFSKAFGLAGLRLGYAIATATLAERLRRHLRVFHLDQLSLAAGCAALEDRDHLNETVRVSVAGRRVVAEELDRLGVEHWPSQGNFILMRPPCDETHGRLLERGVLVRRTERNGLPAHLRVSIGDHEANRAFIAAMEEIVSG